MGDVKAPPKPILIKGFGVDEMTAFINGSSKAFLDMDPLEFARQLTIVDARMYRVIQPKECLEQGWEKPDKWERSPNVSKMIRQTNNVSCLPALNPNL
jgi:hypothetical protein